MGVPGGVLELSRMQKEVEIHEENDHLSELLSVTKRPC